MEGRGTGKRRVNGWEGRYLIMMKVRENSDFLCLAPGMLLPHFWLNFAAIKIALRYFLWFRTSFLFSKNLASRIDKFRH